MTIALIVIGAIIVIAVLYFIVKRNSIIAARNRVDESWSGIDVQLKRRHDLVPNLVETVKGYAAHESETFEKTTKARAEAMSARASRKPRSGAEADRALADAARSPRTTRRCAPPRTSSSSAATSPSSRTKSRPRDGSTTPTCSPTTPTSNSSRARSSPTRAASRARVLRDRGRLRARAGLGQLDK
jgi:hypothetical protein